MATTTTRTTYRTVPAVKRLQALAALTVLAIAAPSVPTSAAFAVGSSGVSRRLPRQQSTASFPRPHDRQSDSRNRPSPIVRQRARKYAPTSNHGNGCRASTTTLRAGRSANAVLDREEPLSVIFQRALVLQRAGSYQDALKEYDVILKAAEQCNIDPAQYAEVHVNVGALHMRLGQPEHARHHFRCALSKRKIGKVYVNLAVLMLQELKTVQDRDTGRSLLNKAQTYCRKALAMDDDSDDIDDVTKNAAKRLLDDIERMTNQL